MALDHLSTDDQPRHGRDKGNTARNCSPVGAFMDGAGRTDAARPAAGFHSFERLQGSFGRVDNLQFFHTAFFQLSAHDLCQRAHGSLIDVRHTELCGVKLIARRPKYG